jgi:hypothetical protein
MLDAKAYEFPAGYFNATNIKYSSRCREGASVPLHKPSQNQ